MLLSLRSFPDSKELLSTLFQDVKDVISNHEAFYEGITIKEALISIHQKEYEIHVNLSAGGTVLPENKVFDYIYFSFSHRVNFEDLKLQRRIRSDVKHLLSEKCTAFNSKVDVLSECVNVQMILKTDLF
jgi:hypothetical protein